MKVKEFQNQKNIYEKKIELLEKHHNEELNIQENKINEKEKIIAKLDMELANKKKKLEILNEKMMSMMNEINNFKVKFKSTEYDMKVEMEKIKDDFRAREIKYKNEISMLNKDLKQNQEIIIKLNTNIKRKEDDIKNIKEMELIRMKEIESSIFQCLHKNSNNI
ncbi:hypothetical protein LY90DRAFT_669871 [Neocallimastix californiae]|uniref:Uncharacterized protein n=1 Tax=Neocallimastix californiae TaxID=1754190 RepID=A0A1Y2D5X5_9FUNG|nr:hypothetical protein LY90DRAFT_669871 [Neocallimastix californiae]|eukprot:ORY54607.1 hypothetical protein LY90DRAFT_669871 [Neocallimastix californiae]